jgi:hypothetical protein
MGAPRGRSFTAAQPAPRRITTAALTQRRPSSRRRASDWVRPRGAGRRTVGSSHNGLSLAKPLFATRWHMSGQEGGTALAGQLLRRSTAPHPSRAGPRARPSSSVRICSPICSSRDCMRAARPGSSAILSSTCAWRRSDTLPSCSSRLPVAMTIFRSACHWSTSSRTRGLRTPTAPAAVAAPAGQSRCVRADLPAELVLVSILAALVGPGRPARMRIGRFRSRCRRPGRLALG